MDYREFRSLVISEMDTKLEGYDCETLEEWLDDLTELIDSLKE